jgi:hypothetical protein
VKRRAPPLRSLRIKQKRLSFQCGEWRTPHWLVIGKRRQFELRNCAMPLSCGGGQGATFREPAARRAVEAANDPLSPTV